MSEKEIQDFVLKLSDEDLLESTLSLSSIIFFFSAMGKENTEEMQVLKKGLEIRKKELLSRIVI